MKNEVLDFLNGRIREEHGNRVNMESKWMDAEVDSFGTTMVFLDMDEKYGGFNGDWLVTLTGETTIKEIVERALDESTEPQVYSSQP